MLPLAWHVVLLFATTPGAPSILERCGYAPAPDDVWTLPSRLAEISGLAYLPGRGLLAHDDERGRLFLLDSANGRVHETWPLLGEPRDDFEGIALAGPEVVLQTSGGRLYRMPIPDGPGRPIGYRVIDQGLSDACELEGLAFVPESNVLLLPCKTLRREASRVGLRIYRWDLSAGRLAWPATLDISRRALRRVSPWATFHASAIEAVPAGGVLVLSARQRAVMELSAAGELIGLKRLDRRLHPQPEGITLTVAGDLLISDEANGAHPRLSLYRCRA